MSPLDNSSSESSVIVSSTMRLVFFAWLMSSEAGIALTADVDPSSEVTTGGLLRTTLPPFDVPTAYSQ